MFSYRTNRNIFLLQNGRGSRYGFLFLRSIYLFLYIPLAIITVICYYMYILLYGSKLVISHEAISSTIHKALCMIFPLNLLTISFIMILEWRPYYGNMHAYAITLFAWISKLFVNWFWNSHYKIRRVTWIQRLQTP